MRTAILSDIHSNLPALEAALEEIQKLGISAVFCLGDVVGYGAFPNECIDLVRSHCKAVVQGNHDSAIIGETPLSDFNQYGQAAIKWTTKVLDRQHNQFLKSLPLLLTVKRFTMVHSSPLDPHTWSYVLTTSAAERNFTSFNTDICFIGHTHVPVVIGSDGTINAYRTLVGETQGSIRYIINVGSIGQPRDGDPRSAFGTFDDETFEYQLIRVEYDIDRAAEAIRKAGLPKFLAQRLYRGV